MTQTVYAQHDTAFASVSAYVIARDGQLVATIAFRHPRDGAGRLYAYVHWLGTEMVRGFASGGGYDKASAACADAWRKRAIAPDDEPASWPFWNALADDNGYYWHQRLEAAGFSVWQAV